MKNTYPKTLQEVYNEKKKCIDTAYLEMYHMIEDDIDNDEEYSLDSDSLNELVVDLMLSNVLGTVTSYDHVYDLIKRDTNVNIISELETIADNIDGDSYTADCILDLIAKLKQ